MERSRLFVGRETEIAHVDGWLKRQNAPTEMVFVSGMGGIGKSALLLKFLDMSQNADMFCIWLDGRACRESPSGYLEAVQTRIDQQAPGRKSVKASIAGIAAAVAGTRTVLCIDNFEYLNKIEGWLREVFIPELPASDVLIVLAGRQHLALEWQKDLAWRGRLKHMRLEPLSRREAWNYYANLGLEDRAEVETLIQDTHGHPLAMAIAADNVNRAERTTPSGAASVWPVSHLVSAQLLREVVAPELHDVLDLLCILPQANQEQLNRLLPSPLTVSQLHQLTQLSFVRPTMEGLALHDVARAHLQGDYLRREPKRYQSIRRRIVEDACRALRAAEPREKNSIAARLLSICRDALPRGAFSLHPVAAAFDIYREGDLPHLHHLIDEQLIQLAISLPSEAEAHPLLDELAANFPESIRVFRSDKGIPLMFHAGLMLYRETCRFLKPRLPFVLEACFLEEAERMSRLRYEQADTYLHFLGGVDQHDPIYTGSELYELMFTDGFSRILSMGIRLTLTPKSDRLKARFAALGFQTRPLQNLDPTHPAHGDTVFELDLRTRDFGDWVSSFLDIPLPGKGADSLTKVSAEDVKTAFSNIGDISALDDTSAARRLGCTGRELQGMLNRLLVSNPPPAPLNLRNQTLLSLLSENPSLSPEAAASKLHISRATYYRHLREAFDKTVHILNKC